MNPILIECFYICGDKVYALFDGEEYHGSALYVCYLGMYLINGWLSVSLASVGGFSVLFVGTYLLIWLIVYIIEKQRAKSLNRCLKELK